MIFIKNVFFIISCLDWYFKNIKIGRTNFTWSLNVFVGCSTSESESKDMALSTTISDSVLPPREGRFNFL